MATERLTSIRFSKETNRQLEWLIKKYGEPTPRVVSRALDLLYKEEIKKKEQDKNVN